ncbi:allantoinase AllB [Micromonospora sp. CPCC 206061]|uniref:allantoinase AllB n=1 Tax=Micromonospora sp. CPCC 206061 TaxID=3122410 RepID=UPI002FF27D51
MSYDLVLRSRRVVTPDGERPAAVCVHDGRIAAVEPYEYGGDDLGDLVLLPGLVDTHVHVNEPGRTEWEGFATATRAAAAGGITTILDMPLNSLPPTVDVTALDIKRKAASGQCHVDVGFWGGAVPGNAADLPVLYDAGVFGFKAFLVDSGVPEFPPLDAHGLRAAMRAVDALFVVHAEDPSAVGPAPASRRYVDFMATRPPAAEVGAVSLAASVARETGGRVHILHLSAADALTTGVSFETCPHYLTLAAEEVPDGATEYKCCPPIRDAANREALWQALASGAIDCVVSDHSPCTPDLKRSDSGDFAAAWGGISSLQLGLSLMWTGAAARGFGLADVARWMAQRPAEIAGLRRKGRIAPGYDADLVAFDPLASFTVDADALHHRNPVTPYHGRTLQGVVRTTWLRGIPVDFSRPSGHLLLRDES